MSTLISKFKNHLFLLRYTSNFKKDIFFALFFILIATLSILYVGFIIKSLVESLSHSSNSKEIMYFFSLLIGSIIVSSLAVFGRIYFFGQLGEKLIKDLRDSLFQHLLGQDIFFFESHRTGELVSRIMSDTHVIQIVLIGSASSAVRNGIMLLGSSIMMLLISPLLFLILCIGSGLIAIPSIFLGKKIRHFSKNAQTKSADICAHIEETINSIKTIKANCYEGENIKEFHKKTLAECLAVCKRIIYFGLSVASASFLSFFLLISVVYFAYHNLDLYNLSASKLSAFAYYGIISGYTLSQFNDLISDFYRATGASDRIKELFKISPAILVEKNSCVSIIPSKSFLQFKSIDFSYPSNSQANTLKNINFEIYPGEHVALVGASGAGKSTIFNLILRFYDPASGHILFKGEDLRTLYFDEFRSKVAIVPQDPFIFSTTILENIRLGIHNCTIEDIKRAAELSYSLNFIEDLHHGFHTYVGEKGVRLSGGQKQRIALARAILKNPELLLLDEATSSLDSESENCIKKSLEKFLINKTSITIAHRLSTIRHCDKILLMENGEITAVGHHDELISNNAYYSKLVKMQFMSSLPRQSA